MKKYTTWIKATIVFQLLTAAIHGTSFFVEQPPANETEIRLNELVTTYKMDAGAGFHPTFMSLFHSMSISFDLLLLLGGILNWYFLKRKLSPALWKGLLLIEVIIFGLAFVAMAVFTFLPPIACTGLIFVSLLVAWITTPSSQQSTV